MFLNMNNVCSLLAFKKVVIIYKKGGAFEAFCF